MTPEQLAACTGSNIANALLYLPQLELAWDDFGINTPIRQAAFLAQCGCETLYLTHMRELWGPTPAQVGYEGRRDLGNTETGDGKKFMGRGFLMLTGHANYAKMSEALATDFVANPELLEQPDMAVRSAMEFWNWKGLSPLADVGDFARVTLRINGGTNGAETRNRLFSIGRQTLGC